MTLSANLLKEGTSIKIKPSLKVRDFMRPEFWTLTEDGTLSEVIDIIMNKKIDSVPIVSESEKLIGLVTRTQLIRELVKGSDLNTKVTEFMLTEVYTADPDDEVEVLISVNTGNLPIVRNGYVVGLVTLSDTVRAYFSSLLAIRQELHAILDSTPNGIITIDEEGYVILANKACTDFFGLPLGQIIGKSMSSIIPHSELSNVLYTGEVAIGKKVKYQDKVFISNHGPVISNDKVIGAVSVFQDISDVKLILDELDYTKKMKEELDAIIDCSFDGILMADEKGIIIRANEAYSRITGVPREQIIGKTGRQLSEEGLLTQSVSEMVIDCQESVTLVEDNQNGHTVVRTGNPVFDGHGELYRIVVNIRDITELNHVKHELQQVLGLTQLYQNELNKLSLIDQYVFRSPKSRDMVDLCVRLGLVDATVLIQGESGVGKEIAANIIHSNSSRREKPFISINCAAIPENLLESELFGYSPGAFTGAGKEGKAGIFEIAHGGTLFLDEIAELPLLLQGKLLRAIQQREITRVGSTKPMRVNVRIIAATNRDLEEMVASKHFRKDLYYRLNVVPIIVPPLRERKVEVPFLINHFLGIFNAKYGLNRRLDERAISDLMNYDWPGNIRELENLIERVVITSNVDVIKHIDIVPTDRSHARSDLESFFDGQTLKKAVDQVEENMIRRALESGGTTRKAAEILGVSQPTIVRKAARYNITIDDN